ncbi:MAG TPA: CopG family transcriptional regulator [Thermoanaerobaculia bacterium]|nr:CopG family transcriptional regulator [Thermoanaerobaculia bacterium]
MPEMKRATIYFDPVLHRALRMKSADTDTSISDLVNAAVRDALLEDADDLEDLDKIRREPNIDFETVVRDLKRRGKL